MGFSVRDLDRSIRFYCDVLGATLLREPYDGDSPSFSGRMALVGFGMFGLDLFEHAGNGGEPFEPARTGLDHLAFGAQSVAEVKRWASWLDECGISH
jgi:glyoxylase I family protein